MSSLGGDVALDCVSSLVSTLVSRAGPSGAAWGRRPASVSHAERKDTMRALLAGVLVEATDASVGWTWVAAVAMRCAMSRNAAALLDVARLLRLYAIILHIGCPCSSISAATARCSRVLLECVCKCSIGFLVSDTQGQSRPLALNHMHIEYQVRWHDVGN